MRLIPTFASLLLALLVAAVEGADGSGAVSLTIPPDNRSAAMGGAFTAVAEGAAAVWWNPGALPFQQPITIRLLTYDKLVPGLADDVSFQSYGVSGTYSWGGVGAQYSRLSYGKSDAVNVDGEVFATYESFETNLHLGVGVDVLRLLMPPVSVPRNLMWGIGTSFKHAHVELAPESVIPDAFGSGSGEASAWDFDVGTILLARKPLDGVTHSGGRDYVGGRLGVQFNTVLGRELEFVLNEQSDPLPQSMRIGMALEAVLGETRPNTQQLRVLLAYERERNLLVTSLPSVGHFGLEISAGREFGSTNLFVSPRVGYIDDPYSAIQDYTIGVGVGGSAVFGETLVGARLDYASVPQAFELERQKTNFTLAGWVAF